MRIKDLTKSYDGKIVVDCVNFKIPKGKVLSLIGPNGAGKSTVMGIISRLIACDAGSVDFEGKPIHQWKGRELAKQLAAGEEIPRCTYSEERVFSEYDDDLDAIAPRGY